jgi:DNA helicase HerA-like ATPase
VAQLGLAGYTTEASPVVFWDLYGKAGHPVRATISEIGPPLLARMLELNDTQSGNLEIAFKLADDRGLLLLDLDDLREPAGGGRSRPPKLIFIFDEAHLLFDDAPPALHTRSCSTSLRSLVRATSGRDWLSSTMSSTLRPAI